MSLVDAISCPYCAGPLFKESYYFRCERDHRFRSTLSAAPTSPAGGGSAEGGETFTPGEAAGASLVLQVIWHTNREEIGRRHTFPLAED